LAILAHVTWHRAQPLTQAFIGNYARTQVFWTFDRLHSISGARLMA